MLYHGKKTEAGNWTQLERVVVDMFMAAQDAAESGKYAYKAGRPDYNGAALSALVHKYFAVRDLATIMQGYYLNATKVQAMVLNYQAWSPCFDRVGNPYFCAVYPDFAENIWAPGSYHINGIKFDAPRMGGNVRDRSIVLKYHDDLADYAKALQKKYLTHVLLSVFDKTAISHLHQSAAHRGVNPVRTLVLSHGACWSPDLGMWNRGNSGFLTMDKDKIKRRLEVAHDRRVQVFEAASKDFYTPVAPDVNCLLGVLSELWRIMRRYAGMASQLGRAIVAEMQKKSAAFIAQRGAVTMPHPVMLRYSDRVTAVASVNLLQYRNVDVLKQNPLQDMLQEGMVTMTAPKPMLVVHNIVEQGKVNGGKAGPTDEWMRGSSALRTVSRKLWPRNRAVTVKRE